MIEYEQAEREHHENMTELQEAGKKLEIKFQVKAPPPPQPQLPPTQSVSKEAVEKCIAGNPEMTENEDIVTTFMEQLTA